MGPGMASSNGFIMVYRLSLIAGIAGSVLALARVQRLLRPSIDGLPWEIVLVAAAAMGAAITWAGLAYRVKGRWVALVNLVVMALVVIRISVPATTWGIFPTSDSFGELRAELEFARDVIRSGVAPVIPIVGVIAVLAAVFWALGALVVWGALRRRPVRRIPCPNGALSSVCHYGQGASRHLDRRLCGVARRCTARRGVRPASCRH